MLLQDQERFDVYPHSHDVISIGDGHQLISEVYDCGGGVEK